MSSWKTTVAGLAAMFSVVAKIVVNGSIDWAVDGPAIMAGLGLLMAKDHNVTGGTNKNGA